MNNNTSITMPLGEETTIQEELAEQIDVNNVDNLAAYSPFRVDAKELDESSWGNFLIKVDCLPERTKDIIFNSETIDFLIDLSFTFNLQIEQSKGLTRIVRDILLGDIKIGDMNNEISDRLQIDDISAEKIKTQILNGLLGVGSSDKPSQPSSFAPFRPKIPDKPDLKIEPSINRNNVVDLRNPK